MNPSNEMEEVPSAPGGSGTCTRAGGNAKLVTRAGNQRGKVDNKPPAKEAAEPSTLGVKMT